MRTKKYIVIAIVIAAIAIAVAFSYGFVPVLKVNGRTFTYAQFSKMEHAIGKFNTVSGKTPAGGAELKAHTFLTLMEQTLLDEVITKTDASLFQGADDLVAATLSNQTDMAKITEATDRLYGLSLNEFKKLVLLPQAKKDLILKQYETDNAGIQKLWDDVRVAAVVKVYYPGFYWDGEIIKQK